MKYDITKHGAVEAIRIYFDKQRTVFADIRTAYGFGKTIIWTHPDLRKEFESGINGYTYIYDERDKKEFNEWCFLPCFKQGDRSPIL